MSKVVSGIVNTRDHRKDTAVIDLERNRLKPRARYDISAVA